MVSELINETSQDEVEVSPSLAKYYNKRQSNLHGTQSTRLYQKETKM